VRRWSLRRLAYVAGDEGDMIVLSCILSVAVLGATTPDATQPVAVDTEQQQADPQDPQGPPTPAHTGIRALVGDIGEDLKHLPERDNVVIALVGGAMAVAVHPADASLNTRLQSHSDAVDDTFAPGKYVGGTVEQIAFSLGTYAFGRWRDAPKVAHVGMDLIQAQILTEILVEPLKFSVRRLRPDGSNHQSFPSGHAAITFATATVIERHLGWRQSALAYVIASYVASSRLHDNVHFASDVVFGAAVGAIAGRTVVHHASDYWAVSPVAVPGGGVAVMVSRRRSH
jgi:PAP2 superfamily protein